MVLGGGAFFGRIAAEDDFSAPPHQRQLTCSLFAGHFQLLLGSRPPSLPVPEPAPKAVLAGEQIGRLLQEPDIKEEVAAAVRSVRSGSAVGAEAAECLGRRAGAGADAADTCWCAACRLAGEHATSKPGGHALACDCHQGIAVGTLPPKPYTAAFKLPMTRSCTAASRLQESVRLSATSAALGQSWSAMA